MSRHFTESQKMSTKYQTAPRENKPNTTSETSGGFLAGFGSWHPGAESVQSAVWITELMTISNLFHQEKSVNNLGSVTLFLVGLEPGRPVHGDFMGTR